MRLIDADRVTEGKFHSMPLLQKYSDRGLSYMYGWNDALDAVAEKAPTVEAVPKEQLDLFTFLALVGRHVTPVVGLYNIT